MKKRLAVLGPALLAAAAGGIVASRRKRSSASVTPPIGGVTGGLTRGSRTAGLAKVSGATAVSYLKMAGSTIGAGDEKKAEAQAKFEIETAEQAVAALGEMKGALMKVGQMASYLDQGLPSSVRNALSQLQSDAPPMAYSLVSEVIASELGGAPEEVFARFERVPIAAASIGQVHRAVTHDGDEVVVKVQYPGVGDAIRADLSNGDLLFRLLGMLFPGLDPKPLVAELTERLIEEVDYVREAANQREFAAAYFGHPTISVPEVFDDFSTERVLTTAFASGSRWSEMLTWPQEERNLAAETIYRFAFGGIYRLGMFNGDPHPGNYLFEKGGNVTFLDFGLCKRFKPEEVQLFEDFIVAIVLERDIVKFRRAIEAAGILKRDSTLADEQVEQYFTHFYEFVMQDKDMTFTPEYAAESVRRYFDLGSPHAEIMKSSNLPPSFVLMQRINLGLFALLGEMSAQANWRRIANEIWPFVDGEPSTPMGVDIAAWQRALPNGFGRLD